MTNTKSQSPIALATLTKHPNGKIYVPLDLQAKYNYVLTNTYKLDDELTLDKICKQYTETITQAEFRSRMSDGSIRLSNGRLYTVNWIRSAAICLASDKLFLCFRTPLDNIALHPRVLVTTAFAEQTK